MRYLLLILALISFQAILAQKKGIRVTAQNHTIQVNPDEENSAKVLPINSKLATAKTGKLTVVNSDWMSEKEMKRSFEIFDGEDRSIALLTACKTSGKYEVGLKSIVPKMVKGQNYFLYTIAIPRDPKKAAVVRVRRVLVCSITLN